MQSGRGRGRGRGGLSAVSMGRGRAISQRMALQNPNVLALNVKQNKRMELNNYAIFFKKYAIRVPSNHRGNWREWEYVLKSWLERHNSSITSRKNRKKLGLNVVEKSPKSEKPKKTRKPKNKSSPRS